MKQITNNIVMTMVLVISSVVMILTSCAKVEFEEMSEYPVANVSNVSMKMEENGWQVFALYFLDKDTGKVKSKIRKIVNGNRWYYYKCDSLGNYKVMNDVDPFIILADYELGKVAVSFTYKGDTINLHKCEYFPKSNPEYSLIVVTRKEDVTK